MKSSRLQKVLNHFVGLLLFVFIFVNALQAVAGPGKTTYQAKIVKPDGYPLEASSVNFKFTILDPLGSCILYSETYSSVNMTSTGGLISFSLGSGVKTYPASATTFEQVFSNITPSLSCDTGGPANYTPTASDIRKIVMQFHDGSGWQTLPAMSINAVPYAMYANEATKLNGLQASDFVQVSTVPTCAASEALRYTGTGFTCVAVGSSVTSGSVITALGYTPADGASVTALTSNVSSVSSTVASVSSTVFSVSSTVTSLQNSVAASFAAITSSQWTTSGTNIFYNTGNIGIGTTTPVTKLDVSGGVRIGAESTTCAPALAGTLRYNASNVEYCNGTSWQAFGVSGAGITNFNGSTSGTQSFANATGGTAPAFNTSNGVHTLNIPLASTGSVTAGLISNTDYTTFTNKITSSAASIAQVLGYVPANDAASGTYAQKANNLSDLTNVATARTNLGLGTFATASSIDLGSASATGTLAVARLPSFTGDATIAAASNTIVLSNSGVIAGTYTKVTVDSKGRVTSSSALASSDVTTALGYTPANSATTVSSQWSTSGTTINYMNGNVGIGTTNPSQKLDVNGNIKIGYNYGIMGGGDSLTTVMLMTRSDQTQSGTLSYDGWGNYAFSNKLAVGSATSLAGTSAALYVNGNVGIGTTSPGAVLDVQAANGSLQVKSTASNNNAYAAINAAGTGTPYISFQKASTEDWEIGPNAGGVGANHTFNFWDSASSVVRLSLATDGNVGIGTTAPTAKLHLAAGTTSVAPLKFTSGTLLTSAQSGTMEYDGTNFYLTDSTNTRRAIAANTNPGTYDNVSNINSSGNITMTPVGSVVVSATTASTNSSTGALIVKGGLGVAGNIYTSGTIVTSSNIQGVSVTATSGMISPYIFGGTAASNNIVIDSTTSSTKGNILLAPNGGNIGIGTTTPGSRLTVSGGGIQSDGLTASGGGVPADALIWSHNASGGYVYAAETGNDSNAGFRASVGGVTRMTMETTAARNKIDSPYSYNLILNETGGNVGIGTTSPAAKLHVDGSIMVGTPSASFTTSVGVPANNPGGHNAAMVPTNISFGSGGANMTYKAVRNGANTFNDEYITFATHEGGVSIGERMRITPSGNVGVGTSSPNMALHVAGPKAAGARVGFNLDASLTNTGGKQWLLYSTDDTDGSYGGGKFLIRNGTEGVTALTATAGGNVGIGTTAPTAKLHLASGTTSVAPLKFTSGTLLTSPQSGTIEYDGANFYLTDSTNTRRAIAANTNPGTYDNVSNINSSGNITMTPVGSVVVSATTASTNSSTGALVVKGGLGVAGSTNIAQNLNVSGSSVIDGSLKISSMASGSVLFAGAGGAITQDNSNFYWDEANKRLGIGTTSPDMPLTVRGANTLANLQSTAASSLLYFTPNGFNQWRIGAGNDTANDFGIRDMTSNAVRLMINSSGNVGIGTSSPTFRLDVAGDIGLKTNATYIYGKDTLGNNTRMLGVNSSNVLYVGDIDSRAAGVNVIATASDLNLIAQSANNVLINTSGTERMRVTAAGNVGIGTTNPTRALDVSGGIRVANSINPFIQISKTDVVAKDWYLQYNTFGDDGIELRNTTDSVTGLRITDSGNVGIGTTSPSDKLHVDGGNIILSSGSSAYTAVMVKNTSTGHSLTYYDAINGDFVGGDYGYIGQNNSGYMEYNIGAASPAPYHVFTGGNVGIGTTTPSYPLDVNGTIRGAGFAFSAPPGDPAPVITTRTVPVSQGASTEKTELILFHSNDPNNGAGADQITLRAPALSFQTYNDAGVSDINNNNGYNERMYITPTGNVGIGTTNPTSKLSMNVSAAYDGIRIDSTSNGFLHSYVNAGAGSNNGITQAGDKAIIYGGSTIDNAGGLVIAPWKSNTSGIRLDASGNIGIGTTSPNALLDVKKNVADGTGENVLRVTDTAGQYRWRVDQYFDMFMSNSSGTDTIVIKNSGNVGIKTTSPSYSFQVQKTSSAPAMMIGGGFAGGPRLQSYGLDADPLAWMGLGTDMSGDIYELSIYTSAVAQNGKITFGQYNGASYTERMRIHGNGNVGIGTTAPSTKLHVQGDVRIVDGNQAAGRVLASDANGNAAWKQTIIHGTVASVGNSSTAAGNRVSSGVSITLPPGKWQITGMGITTGASCRADFGIRTLADAVVKYTLMPVATGDFQTATVTGYVDIATTTTYELYINSRAACTSTIHVDNTLWELTATGVAY